MTTNNTDETSPKKKGLSRRTVVAGTAWAVPAIVVAGAAPAFAASGPVQAVGNVCKRAGRGPNKQYVFQLTVSQPGTLTINSVTINTETVKPPNICQNPVSAVSGKTYTFVVSGLSDQANGTASINYTFTPTSGTATSQNLNLNAGSLPQLGSANCTIPPADVDATGCPIN